MNGMCWRRACGLVLSLALLATVPTVGDPGLTWDEPAYRYSQMVSVQWWQRLAEARSFDDLRPLFTPDALLYYWPYARHGFNFHPPLAGQLNLLTYALFGAWMKDIPARRMASAIEFALTATILFGFLARRYGGWVGAVSAGALLLMPRLYGQAHLAETDTPGLLLWALTSILFWKGLHEPNARRWRVVVGVLLGLAFVEKMGAVIVLVPLTAWLVAGHLVPLMVRRGTRADWIDGLVTSAAMLVPLALIYQEVHRLAREFLRLQGRMGYQVPSPAATDLFRDHPVAAWSGTVLLIPLGVWLARRLASRLWRTHPVWGVERPALETWTTILAFAPVVSWLGNPAWWRETLPRLAHYYAINTTRRGLLPDIRVIYLGQIYNYSLPWHNAWVLMAITIPLGVLVAALAGLLVSLGRVRRDRLPLFVVLQMATLPVVRMLPTPAHDGVRLFLPTFFFVAALAGWGLIALADGIAKVCRIRAAWLVRGLLAGLVLGSSAWQLIRIHPFELSYYNEAVGGPRGAWRAGFELSYWYDAFNGRTLADLNDRLPSRASLDFLNDHEKSAGMVFQTPQSLGELRGDLQLGMSGQEEFAGQALTQGGSTDFPYVWLLTHDSKATPFTRLLFAMRPWYALRPWQLDGLRVATVADPPAVARAWALWLLTDDAGSPDRPEAPPWVHRRAPWLSRFWGEGVGRVNRLGVHEPIFAWSKVDPEGLRAAARTLSQGRPVDDDPDARRLLAMLSRNDQPWNGLSYARTLLQVRPTALLEAVEILIARPDAVRRVLLRHSYTDPARVGGYLDQSSAVRPIAVACPDKFGRGSLRRLISLERLAPL